MSKLEKAKNANENVKSHTNAWLMFLAFVIYIAATTLPETRQVSEIRDNREGIECIIEQLAEHRINNRTAHVENADHHKYEYHIDDINIPGSIEDIDDDVCDRWLGPPDNSTTTRDVEGSKGD